MMIKLLIILWSIAIYADVYDCSKEAFEAKTETLHYAVRYMNDRFDAVEQGIAGEDYLVYQELTKKVMSTEQLQEYVAKYCQGKRQGQEDACSYFANIIRFTALREHYKGEGLAAEIIPILNREGTKQKNFYRGVLKDYAIADQQSFNDIIDHCFHVTKGALEGVRAHNKKFVITGDGLFKEEDWITGFMHGYHLQSLPEDMGLLQDMEADGHFHGLYRCAIAHDLDFHESVIQDCYDKSDRSSVDGLFLFLQTVWTDACKNAEAFEPVKLVLFSMLHEAHEGQECFPQQKSRIDAWKKYWRNQDIQYCFHEHFLGHKSSLYPTSLQNIEDVQENMQPAIFACYKKRGEDFLSALPVEYASDAEDVVMAILLYWYHQYLERFWVEVSHVAVNQKTYSNGWLCSCLGVDSALGQEGLSL